MRTYTLTIKNTKSGSIRTEVIQSRTAQDAVTYALSYAGEFDKVVEVIRGKNTICTNWK